MSTNVLALLPELILTLTGVLIMMAEPCLEPDSSRKPLGWIAIAGTVAALVASWYQVSLGHPPRLLRHHPGRRLLRPLPLRHRSRRSRHPPRLARLLRRQRQPRRRVLRPALLRRRRHDAHDLLGRAAHGLRRPRDLLHHHLHPLRLPQRPGHRLRVLHQVLPARLLRHRLLPLRRRPRLRSHRLDRHLRHRPRPRDHHHPGPRLHRPRPDPHRPRLQGLRRSLPRLDARRLPGRARSRRRPHVHRAQGRRLRRPAPHHLHRLPQLCSTAGRS